LIIAVDTVGAVGQVIGRLADEMPSFQPANEYRTRELENTLKPLVSILAVCWVPAAQGKLYTAPASASYLRPSTAIGSPRYDGDMAMEKELALEIVIMKGRVADCGGKLLSVTRTV
jgi:hypothetical protein